VAVQGRFEVATTSSLRLYQHNRAQDVPLDQLLGQNNIAELLDRSQLVESRLIDNLAAHLQHNFGTSTLLDRLKVAAKGGVFIFCVNNIKVDAAVTPEF
jgi:hypothetical protein